MKKIAFLLCVAILLNSSIALADTFSRRTNKIIFKKNKPTSVSVKTSKDTSKVSESITANLSGLSGNKKDELVFSNFTDKSLETYGRTLLESLKASKPEKLLGLSMTIVEYVNTTLAKTQNQEVRNNIINDLLKEDPKNKKWEKETIRRFDKIKQNNKINWKNAEFIDFKFKKDDKKSKDLNFSMGSASLFFKTDGKQYEFKIDKFGQLLSGWKGFEYDVHLKEYSDKLEENKITDSKNKPIESYGRALLESFKSDSPEKLLALSATTKELINTIHAKTQDEETKIRFIAKSKKKDPNNERKQNETKEEFNTIKQNIKINWQNIEYVDFMFKKQNRASKYLNFEVGGAILYFKVNGQLYTLKVHEFSQLLNGWKGGGFRLDIFNTNVHANYGILLLESLKASNPELLLNLSVTIDEFKKTVQAKTSKKFKNKFIAEVAKENNEQIIKMTKENFDRLKQNKTINWQNTEFVDFKFDRQKDRSINLNFDWGKGTLLFKAGMQQYELRVSEMTQLLTGWKGMGYKLNKVQNNNADITSKSLENFGRALLESFKAPDPEKLFELIITGNEFFSTVQEKTQSEKAKAKVLEDIPRDTKEMVQWRQNNTKRQFGKIKQNEQIDWQNAEYINFEFIKNESESKELNFNSGKGILIFQVGNQQYELKVRELFQLLSGWKGWGYSLTKVDNPFENSGSQETFYIPSEEVLKEGSGRLSLVYNTGFKGLSEDGFYLLFSEELNTDMIGGPPAINYQLVSSRSGMIIRTIAVSYNPDLGEGKELMKDMDLGQIDEINESQVRKAEKELEIYKFSEIRERSNAYVGMVDVRENEGKSELVFSIMRNDGEEMIQLNQQSFMTGRTVEVNELIVSANEMFVIVSYYVPGSMEFPESLTGAVVIGSYQLSELYKKIGFNYYDYMIKKGGYGINKESAEKSLENLNKALNLNGANDFAVYYLACLYAQMNNTKGCIATLKHLKKIGTINAKKLLEMAKSESDFDIIREIPAFTKFMKTIF